MNVTLNRQLLGLEDLAFGVGTVTQTRGGISGDVTLINAANMPFDASFTLQQVLDTNYASIATVGADLINIDLVATNITSVNSVAAIVDDLATAIAAVAITNADVVLTHADVVLTNADAASTALDKIATNADAASTASDKIATNADAASTALDKVATNADAASTALDKIATNADAASTALDKIATNADVLVTNADVLLTNADVVTTTTNAGLTAADVVTTNADVLLTNADVVLTNADVVTISNSEATTAADVVLTNADVVTSGTNATNAQLKAWISEAEQLTSASYATQAEDVFVDNYSSDGDGTFTATPTTDYSAYHWKQKALAIASGSIDALSDVDTTGKAAGDSLTFNSVSGKWEVDTTLLKSTAIGVTVQGYNANTTIQGNTFNGVSQLVQTDGTGKLPAIDGSQLTNMPAGATVNNTLTSTSTTEALSANMGKTLQDSKQATLVSGTTIKTINSTSLLGSGNIEVEYKYNYTAVKTAAYTAVHKDVIPCNTSALAFTITLPITPAANTVVTIQDIATSFELKPLTVARNGQTIMGLASNMLLDVNDLRYEFIFLNNTWRVSR